MREERKRASSTTHQEFTALAIIIYRAWLAYRTEREINAVYSAHPSQSFIYETLSWRYCMNFDFQHPCRRRRLQLCIQLARCIVYIVVYKWKEERQSSNWFYTFSMLFSNEALYIDVFTKNATSTAVIMLMVIKVRGWRYWFNIESALLLCSGYISLLKGI